MLIPIGQEDATVRRQPWVSYGLIVANLVVFLLTAMAGPGAQWRSEVRGKIQEIAGYFNERPYLQLPPDLAELCQDECQKEVEEQRAEFARQRTLPPDWTIAEEQHRLDDLGIELHVLRNKLPSRRLGYIPKDHRPERAITSMFMHGGWFHLLGNMLFLFVTGPFVEDALGRALFAVLYFFSGFAALGLHIAKFPDSTTPLIGASGAIAGVMGAFLVRYTFRKIRMLYMPFFPYPRPRFTFGVPAFVFLPLWFGEQFLYAANAGAESGVAFWAHVGGFLFGMAAMLAVRATGVERKWIHPAIEKELTLEQNPRLEKALEARVAGKLQDARREVAAVLAKEPSNVDAWRESYEIAKAGRDAGETGRSAARLVDLYARADERDLLVGVLHDVSAEVEGPLPPRLFLAAGAFLEKKGEWDFALDAYERLVARLPGDPSVVRALLRRAEILRGMGEKEAARTALVQARAHPACVEGMIAAVERAQANLG